MADNALTRFRDPRFEDSKEDFSGPFPTIEPVKQEPRRVFERYHRPGDPLMGTAELEKLAQDLGGAETLGDAAITAAGLATGIVQGRNARRASKAADAPPKSIVPPEGGSHGKPLPGNEKIPRELREGVKAKPAKEEKYPELDDGFYLEGEKFLLNTPMKQGAERVWRKEMGRGGVKPIEMQALGMDDFFKANPEPTKDQLLEHYKANKPRTKETTYRDIPEPAWIRHINSAIDMLPNNDAPGYGLQDRARDWIHEKLEPVAKWDMERRKAKNSSDGETRYQNWSLDKPNEVDRWEASQGREVYSEANPTYKEHVRSLAPPPRLKEVDSRIKEIVAKVNMSQADEVLKSREEWGHLKQERDSPEYAAYNYQEDHFPNVPGYLYHHRGAVQKDEKGRKTYNMDELQATGAQKIRDAGPRDEAAIKALNERKTAAVDAQRDAFNEGYDFVKTNAAVPGVRQDYLPDSHQGMSSLLGSLSHHSDLTREQKAQALALSKKIDDAQHAYNLVQSEARNAENTVPGHPITNSMDQVSLTGIRDVIKEAAKSGVEGITITPGDVQNKRYGLSRYVDRLVYFPEEGVLAGHKDGQHTFSKYVPKEQLADYIGKDAAQRLLATEPGDGGKGGRKYHDLDLGNMEIGGKGMREYYDERYPNTMEKELRRLHGKQDYPGRESVKTQKHGAKGQYHELPFNYFPLTPEIKEQVKKGLPLFTAAGLITPQVFNALTQPDDEDRR